MFVALPVWRCGLTTSAVNNRETMNASQKPESMAEARVSETPLSPR